MVSTKPIAAAHYFALHLSVLLPEELYEYYSNHLLYPLGIWATDGPVCVDASFRVKCSPYGDHCSGIRSLSNRSLPVTTKGNGRPDPVSSSNFGTMAGISCVDALFWKRKR
jgi:hypothetical protein